MATASSHAFTRVRAVLAGALVLGVGTTMTLASWTDNEFGSGSFATTKFDVESSINGGTSYADTTSGSPAVLAFSATGMSPNTQRYGNILIRTKAGSVAGVLALGAAVISPSGTDETTVLGAALRYRVVLSTGACDATAFTGSPTWVVGPTASVLTAGAAGTVAVAAATASPGAATGLCFEVSLPSGAANTLQGKTSTALWQVTATSS